MFFRIARVLVCYVHFHINFSLLVKILQKIILKIQFHPTLNQRTGLNFLNIW